jgi:hypothetical protein
MQIEKLSDNWLFERHSKQTIREWLRQLRYFYFKRAWGGHANDGDEFQVAFAFTDRQDLLNKIGQLGLTLNTIPDDFPRPIIGKPYPADEYNKFKNEIKQFTGLEQPGHSVIFGHKAFVWVNDNSIQITISGTRDDNRYEVTGDDLNVCIELEKQFDNLVWQKIIDKSLEKSVCCISQTKYPELYGEETTVPNSTLPKAGRTWLQKLFGSE